MRGNVAEEAQSIGLVAPFLVRTGMRQRPSARACASSTRPASSCPSPRRDDRAPERVAFSRGNSLFHYLREQRHGVGDTPAQGVRRPQGPPAIREIGREVRLLTDAHGPFEQGECPVQVTLAEGQQTDPTTRPS